MSTEEASWRLGLGPGCLALLSHGLSGETSSCPEPWTVLPAVSSGPCPLFGDSGVRGAALLFLLAVGELRPKSLPLPPHSKVWVTRVLLSILAPSYGPHHHIPSHGLRFTRSYSADCRMPFLE